MACSPYSPSHFRAALYLFKGVFLKFLSSKKLFSFLFLYFKVFRESKMLMAEILTTDLSMEDGIDPGNIKLKEDLHYPTVRLLNEVLRDAIYNAEASVNRAVLGLVLDCMVYPVEPLQRAVREQLDNRSGKSTNEDSAENKRLRENNIQGIRHISVF